MNFGNKLKQLRIEKKLKQEDLSKRLNVSRQSVSKYETNERFPDKEILVALTKFFNVSIDYLLGLTDIKEPAEDLIKKGEVVIKPPSKIEKLYEELPAEEKKMLEDYAQYLETRAKLSDKDKEHSATSEVIEEKAN